MQIPIASTATKQSTGNLDRLINFLCPLNIINILLLQVSTGTASKLFRPSSCNPQSEIYNLWFFTGVLAQLVERLNGIEEVTGSNPVGSSLRSQRSAERILSRRSFSGGGHFSPRSINAASYGLASQPEINRFIYIFSSQVTNV